VDLRRHLEKIHSMVIAERGLGLGTDVLTLISTPVLLKDPFLSDLTKICEKMCRSVLLRHEHDSNPPPFLNFFLLLPLSHV
jgi:hypothetical protein